MTGGDHAQPAGGWLAGALTVLMLIAVVLAGLRLLTQVLSARAHRRRQRRTCGKPEHLGGVSVIVPARDRAATIAATVRSLTRSDYPGIEVVVVDDGSTDGTADIVERLGLLGVFVLRQRAAGRPAALNAGIAYAHNDILVLADGDTVVAPDAIGRLIQPLRDPRVGAVTGTIRVADRGAPHGRRQQPDYAGVADLDRRMAGVGGGVPTPPGAIGAFRRDAVRDAGGVSDRTLAQDTDLTVAVVRTGWRVVHEPTAVAWTEAPATARQVWQQRYRSCHGTLQVLWKHRRALTQRGAAGRRGRHGLGHLLLFPVLLPLTAPMVDVYAVHGLLHPDPATVAATWAGFTALQVATAAHALHLHGERVGPLWSLLLWQVVHRWLTFLVVIRAIVTALAGGRPPRRRVARTGAATAQVRAEPPPRPSRGDVPGRSPGDAMLFRSRPAGPPTRIPATIAADHRGRARTGRVPGHVHWPTN